MVAGDLPVASLSLMTLPLMQLSMPTCHSCYFADSCITVNSVNFRFSSTEGLRIGTNSRKISRYQI